MVRDERPALLLAGMLIATIYVIMLIGLTRSSYFIGGAALERLSPHTEILLSRMAPVADTGPALCTVPPAPDDARTCTQALRTLRRVLGMRTD